MSRAISKVLKLADEEQREIISNFETSSEMERKLGHLTLQTALFVNL
jgi:hypothetical protein